MRNKGNLARDGGAVSGQRWKSDGKRLRMHCVDINVSGVARDDSELVLY
jgi:hypothetical protein